MRVSQEYHQSMNKFSLPSEGLLLKMIENKQKANKILKYQEEIKIQREEEIKRKIEERKKKQLEDIKEKERIEKEIQEMNLLHKIEKGEIKQDYSSVYKSLKSPPKKPEKAENLAINQTERTQDQTHRSQDQKKSPEEVLNDVFRFEAPLLASMKAIQIKSDSMNKVSSQSQNILATEIANFTNQISDMREMQKKLVENYKIEIEELRKQK